MPKEKVKSSNHRFSLIMNETGIQNIAINNDPQAQGPSINFPQTPNINIPNPNTVRATPELQTIIRCLIQEVLKENSPVQAELLDEQIYSRDNIDELDKIPDIVRCLRDFKGDPSEYTAWRKSVDRIFELYDHLKGTAKYFGILSIVRNKIVGQANIALESYNTPLNWTAIKQCLNTHYADRRDIGTLEYQLTTLIQGNKSIEDFYQEVYSHFSLILNKISSLGYDRGTETILIESYRNKTLDTFVRGLNGDLPRLLAIKEPTNLPQALYLCQKLANQNFRTSYAQHSQKNNYRPPLPPKKTNFRNFYPELTHFGRTDTPLYNRQNQTQLPYYQQYNTQLPQYQQNNAQPPYYQQQNNTPVQPRQSQFRNQTTPQLNFGNQNRMAQQPGPPPRPLAPKPPVPMDVDKSIRSMQVNYANRPKPTTFLGKRDNPQNTHQPPQKIQRNFHVTTESAENNTSQDMYDMSQLAQYLPEEQPDEQTLNDYIESYDPSQEQADTYLDPNYIDCSDVHFLD